jgi:hypothetical protein
MSKIRLLFKKCKTAGGATGLGVAALSSLTEILCQRCAAIRITVSMSLS